MARFQNYDNPSNPQVVPQVVVQPVVVNPTPQQQAAQLQTVSAIAQAEASVGIYQAGIDQQIVTSQLKTEDEHWVKAYWRPAMAWLYMFICFADFIAFPFLTGIQPVIFKLFGINQTYIPWQSLTLSNGGLIHLAFGTILGVTAWTRGLEKQVRIG